MSKQTTYKIPTMDLVFSPRPAVAAETSITRKAFNTVKIKKRPILGKIIQEKFAFG